MVTEKVCNFIGLVVTFLGVIMGIFLLTTAETILGYIANSILTLLCSLGFIAFLYDIIRKKGKR